MLTLDRTTLFYLSHMNSSANTNQEASGLITEWAEAVEPSLNTSSISKSISNPSVRSLCLTQGSTRSSSASASASASVLSNSILVVSSADRYGIPDEDEIYGPEWDAAIKSPSKGKKRVDNTVSGCVFLSLINHNVAD
jgi:hypothetical protein